MQSQTAQRGVQPWADARFTHSPHAHGTLLILSTRAVSLAITAPHTLHSDSSTATGVCFKVMTNARTHMLMQFIGCYRTPYHASLTSLPVRHPHRPVQRGPGPDGRRITAGACSAVATRIWQRMAVFTAVRGIYHGKGRISAVRGGYVAFQGCNPIYGPQYATLSSKYPFCYNGFGASL